MPTLRDNIVEEYNVVYNNYKLTFSHAIEVIKYYAGTVVTVTGGIIAKVTFDTKINSISVFKGWLLFVLVLLVILGIIGIFFLKMIQNKRRRCILQLNFLRSIMLQNLEKNILDEYNKIAGYTDTINNNKVRKGPAYFWPITLMLLIITLLILGFIYINVYF